MLLVAPCLEIGWVRQGEEPFAWWTCVDNAASGPSVCEVVGGSVADNIAAGLPKRFSRPDDPLGLALDLQPELALRQAPARVKVTCVTPLGEEVASTS
jgi:hypothetical protein